MALAQEPDLLRATVLEEYRGGHPRRCLDSLVEDAEEPEPWAHAWLLARFLRQKKSAAVTDVARAVFDGDALAACSTPGGTVVRQSAALQLYASDPDRLLDIEVCHRWHTRRRCAFRLEGPRRKATLRDLDWSAVVQRAQARVVAAHPRLAAALRFRRATFRRGREEILLAWICPADRDTVRQNAGRVVAGHHDEWIIVRVFKEGNALDVTSSREALRDVFADAVVGAVFGDGARCRRARTPLTGEVLDQLLARLRDPSDDTFRLLEIAAEVPGFPNRPMFLVSNAGQERVEAIVEAVRRSFTYAETWRCVHRVKIAFGDAWRIEVHFPAPDEEIVLTYSDGDRDKEVAAAFEKLMLDELGVEIHPKAGRHPRRREPPATIGPAKPGRATWVHLLDVLDEPAPWQRELLREAEALGVVRVDERSFFRCSDAPTGTPECPGTVEMPFGELDPNDPFRQEDDAEVVCGLCGTPQRPGQFRLPMSHRLRPRIDVHAMWAFILKLVAPELQPVQPGLAHGVVRGAPAMVVFAPLAEQHMLSPALANYFSVCWISVPGDPALAELGERAIDLADLLADRGAAVHRALALGVSGRASPADLLAREPAPSPWTAAAPITAALPVQTPARRIIQADDKGVWIDGCRLAKASADGTRMCFALLAAAARLDEAAGKARQPRTADRLVRLVTDADFGYADVQTWISRTKAAIEKKLPAEPGLADLVIQGGKGDGYRLGPGFECLGLELTDEVANRQRRKS